MPIQRKPERLGGRTRSGFGPGASVLTTRAARKALLLLDYWDPHDVAEEALRTELGVESGPHGRM